MKTLEYYFDDGSHVEFDKYAIDTSGIIKSKKTGKILNTFKTGNYNKCSVQCGDVKRYKIYIGRAILSTFKGKPPSQQHTADHIDRDSNNDILENLRWLCKTEQSFNRCMPGTFKSAFIIIRDENEYTASEWVEYLKKQENIYGRGYTVEMIKHYARRKQNGFSYKKYEDLSGEMWKEIKGSENVQGRWEISNMNRVKHITGHMENVLSGNRLRITNGYPIITINGRIWLCHILAFMTFFPEEYAKKKPGEVILHEDDNKLDFRPSKLRLGTPRENSIDAHYNGKYDGKKSARIRCASYIDGVFEKEHESQKDAVKYLNSFGFEKAVASSICMALNETYNTKSAYGRTWEKIM